MAGFALGAAVPDSLGGALRGLVIGAVVVGVLRLANIEASTLERLLIAGAAAASTVLTTILLSEAPERVTPSFALLLGGVWLITGVAAGFLIHRRQRTSAGLNVALVWAGAGVLAAPMAVTFGYLSPGTESLGVAPFVLISAVVALVGGGATLAGVTGVRGIGIGAAVVVISAFAAGQVGFSLIGLIRDIANIVNTPNFWPPDFGWAVGEADWWWLPDWDFGAPTRPSPLMETFRIAIIASIVGCTAALPVGFMASRITAPDRISYLLDKGFMNVIRTIPDLFWALIFVAGLEVGPLPGVIALFFFSLAIMAKLLSETIDSVDTGPLEAARATGGSHFPAVRVSVLPQVLPNYVAYALYIFELNIRASLILGIVGAGGIGRVLETQRSFYRFDRVLAIVLVIFVVVFVIEQISVALRRRLV